MCSLRGVWVMEHDGHVVFSRRFPTVEKRVLNRTDASVPLPSDTKIAQAIVSEVFRGPVDPTIEKPDSAIDVEAMLENTENVNLDVPYIRNPVCSLLEGTLWPVVIVKKQRYRKLENLVQTLKEATITTVGFLEVFSDVAQPLLEKKDYQSNAELTYHLNSMAPFGTPMETSIAQIQSIIKTPYPEGKISLGAQEKQPSWKPILYKGRPKIDITIREEIRACLYGVSGKNDLIDVQGIVFCKAEIEGLPDITLSLSSPNTIASITVHRTVQFPDSIANPVLCFSPPLTPFQLCRYTISMKSKRVPIHVAYQMRELSSNSVRVSLTVQLDESLHDGLQFCDIIIPFFNRNPASRVEGNPTTGSARILSNRHGVLWEIGEQIPARGRETSAIFTVYFESTGKPLSVDPFITGLNSYAEVRLKTKTTFSGMAIDPRQVQIYPSVKPAINIESELITSQYIVWNSLGDSISGYTPPTLEGLFAS